MRKSLLATAFTIMLLTGPSVAKDPFVPPPPRGAVTHQLGPEEDFPSLAKLYGVSEAELEALNSRQELSAGQTLLVPRPSGGWPAHTVLAGETLWRISKGYGISVEQLMQANSMADNRILPGNVLLLPRAEKPIWTQPAAPTPMVDSTATLEPDPDLTAAPVKTKDRDPASPAPPKKTKDRDPALTVAAAPRLEGTWVEVRLPDNRRGWARVEGLVVGSWQPQSPERVLEVARGFVGVPYKWGGVDPNGWDCSGFMQELFRLGGHQVPRMADAQYEACQKLEAAQLEPGDLVFFNTDGSGISHVGICSGKDRFLHASSSRGVVEDSLQDAYFASRYVGAGRPSFWVQTPDPETITVTDKTPIDDPH